MSFQLFDRVVVVADNYPQDGSWYLGEPGVIQEIDPMRYGDDTPIVVALDNWQQYTHIPTLCFSEGELQKLTPVDYL
jgi:hypothetical protein